MGISAALPAALAVVALGAAVTPPAPPTRTAFVDVFVTGDTGVPLTGLRAPDFEVFEDGAPVPVVECVAPPRARVQQLTLALVVDEAVSQERRTAFGAADRVARDILAGGRSRVMVASWGATVAVVQPFTADPGQVVRALAAPAGAGGGAPGPGTIETVVGALGPLPGRKALVVIGGSTPGAPGRAEAFRSVAESANAAGVTLYWIDATAGTGRGGDGTKEAEEVAAARAAAAATGGFDATGNGDLAEALFQVTRDLRGAWAVSFTPSSRPDGAPHRLEVKVRRDGIAARARTSFADIDDERRIAERSAAALLLGYEDNPLGIQVSLTSERKPGEGSQTVIVLVAVPLATLQFEPKAVSHDCDLALWLAARDGEGQVIRAPKARFPVSVPNDRVLTALTQTAGYTFRVPMKVGPAAVAVTVRDEIGMQASTVAATAAPPEEPSTGATP